MKRIALLISASIALAALFGAGIRIVGSQDSEPIILEPIVKTEECATKFWVQNLGSESATVTCAFKPVGTVCEEGLSIQPGETSSVDVATIECLPTDIVGWVEISADQPIAAGIELPKCKTSKTFLHGVMKEWGDHLCTSVIQITVEPPGVWTSAFLYLRDEQGEVICVYHIMGLTGSEVIDLGQIDILPSGYKGYIQIFAGLGVSVEAEIIKQRCEITPTPTFTPTATPTSIRWGIYLPLIMKNWVPGLWPTPTTTLTPTLTPTATATPTVTPTPTPTGIEGNPITLEPVAREWDGCSSVFEITNPNLDQPLFVWLDFYDKDGFLLGDWCFPQMTTLVNLASTDFDALGEQFCGSVTIKALDQIGWPWDPPAPYSIIVDVIRECPCP